jgi:DNA-binding transcriptional MerR regulator
MAKERLAIGGVSKRTGIPVKTLRFYADEGIVPPSGRSQSGYRLYSDEDVAKLDLVRTLRDAGLGLDAIRAVLRRDMTLSDALRLRLGAVEAHIASLRHVAAALRAALRSEPTEHDVRRLCAVTRLSNEDRKALIECFYEKVSEGIPIDKVWMRAMIEASTPKLPDDPTPAQIDAWIELAGIVSDPTFVASLRENAKDAWKPGFDVSVMREANDEALRAATEARASGLAPESDRAKQIVERYVADMARAAGHPANAAFRAGMLERIERQDPRASRYWELVATLGGKHEMSSRVAEWAWIVAAVRRHLGESAA